MTSLLGFTFTDEELAAATDKTASPDVMALAQQVAAFIQHNKIDVTKVSLEQVMTARLNALEAYAQTLTDNPDKVLEAVKAL